jgi:IS5 family transposase
VKVSLAVTHQRGLMVGARSFPGNPYDAHTLAAQIEQTNTLLQDIGVKQTTQVRHGTADFRVLEQREVHT